VTVAIDYRFVLGTPEPDGRVAGRVADAAHAVGLLDDAATAADLLAGTVTTRGTGIRVRATSAPLREVVADTFGFVATITVAFRPGHADPHHVQEDDVVRLVAALLDQVPGDAVLYRDSDGAVWLLRRNGELSVHTSSEIWTPGRLALLTPPYRREAREF
jgi:hypothetical protein